MVLNEVKSLRGGRIADPVHHYIDYTWMEREILKHRVCQRLRYVSQNGLAHLVYPEARSSRFSHSLGAMHLASHFLEAALGNSNRSVRKRLIKGLKRSVHKAAGRIGIGALPDIRKEFPPEAVEPLLAARHCAPSQQAAVLIAEQSLRLAALFHDLGHLPFSHDGEDALVEFWEGLPSRQQVRSPLAKLMRLSKVHDEKVHERVGHGLALLLFQEEFEGRKDSPHGEATRIAFELAYEILNASTLLRPREDEDHVLRWLHSLMDGDLDVDRCDYIMRDARNYGFDFASYDLDRLLDNLSIRWSRRASSFSLVVKEKGLSALESFLLARFRSYQYGVRHHKVAQVGAALRYAIRKLLECKHEEIAPEVKTFVADVSKVGGLGTGGGMGGSKQSRSDLLDRFAEYDDMWCLRMIRKLWKITGDPWLSVVSWRGPARSLWKRIGDLPPSIRGDVAGWNKRLLDLKDDKQEAIWREVVDELRNDGVLVVKHEFSPWTVDTLYNKGESVLLIQYDDGRVDPASRVSPIIRSLEAAWENDIQVHAFASPKSVVDPDKIVVALEGK